MGAGMEAVLEALPTVSRATIDSLRVTLRDFERFTGKEIRKATKKDVREYATSKLEEGVKPHSVVQYLFRLRAVMLALGLDELAAYTDKLRRSIRASTAPERVVNENELEVFGRIDELLADEGRWRRFRKRDQVRAMVALIADTGMRLGEVLSLRVEDVDVDRKRVTVRKGKGAKTRTVFITDRSVRYLLPLLIEREPGERLFDMPLASASRAVKAAVGISPHKLRHAFAVSFLRKGGDLATLQHILGHESLEVTSRYVKQSLGLYEGEYRRVVG